MDMAAEYRTAVWVFLLFVVLFFLFMCCILLIMLRGFLKLRGNTQRKAELQKAVHLDSKDMFCYGMDTDVGNAFVYGELRAVDPVFVPELNGEYSCVSYVEEQKVKKTREGTESVYRNGKMETVKREEAYYEWKEVFSRNANCKQVTFMDIEFPYEKIPLQPEHVARTSTIGDRRYTWKVAPAVMQGTLYTTLENHTISDQSLFFEGLTPKEALDRCLLKKSPAIMIIVIFFITFASLAIVGILLGLNELSKI